MSKLSNLELQASNGFRYGFGVYGIDTSFNELGAVYAITRRVIQPSGNANHDILYIGITDNLKKRFVDHHKMELCKRAGANSICVHLDPLERSRISKEVGLITNYTPRFNELLK